MSADFVEQRHGIASTINLLSQQRRSKIALRGIPSRVDGLFAIKRIFTSDAFSPSFRAVGMDGQQKDPALRGAAKAGLKEMDKRHVNLTQGDGFNFQRNSFEQLAINKTGQPQIFADQRRSEI